MLFSAGFGEEKPVNRGGVGYSPMLMYFVGNTWNDMPEMYLKFGDSKNDIYYNPLLCNGMEGYVSFTEHWRIGMELHSGQNTNSDTYQDTSVYAKFKLSSSGFIIDYAIAIDHNVDVSFGTVLGVNAFQVEYMRLINSVGWNDIFDGRTVQMTQNTLSSNFQFYLKLRISLLMQVLDRVQLKAITGINFSSFNHTKWTINGVAPIGGGQDISMTAPYLQFAILIGI